MIRKLLIGLLALAAPLAAEAQLYPLFGPVNGIMKGNAATPQTTQAASTDVISLFSGCTSSLFLKADGTCANPLGTGVSLSVPAPLTVSGSPGTSLAVTWATGQTANQVLASPNGTTGAVALRALVGADIAPTNLGSTANGGVLSTSILLGTNGGTSNGFFSVTGPTTSLKTFTFPNASATVLTTNAAVTVGQGGTGATTLTGVLKGNGTSAFTAAASSDVIALWSGTCSSTTFLRGDGSCVAAGGGSAGGSNTQVQFNNGGVFGADSGFTYAGSGAAVTMTKATVTNLFECGSTGVTGRQCDLIGNGTGTSTVAYQGIVDQAGTRFGYWGKSSTGAQVSYESDADVALVGNNGTDSFTITSGHAFNFTGSPNAPAYNLNGATTTGTNGLFLPGTNDPAIYAGGARMMDCSFSNLNCTFTQAGGVVAPAFYTFASASPIVCANATFCTVASFTAGNHYALVMCTIAAASDDANYDSIGIAAINGTSASGLTIIKTAALMTMQMSGANVQCKQSSGATGNITVFMTNLH